MGENQIEKPWCVYGGDFALKGMHPWQGYGKIVKEHGDSSVEISFNEKSRIAALWSFRCVRRFDTLLEALKIFYLSQSLRLGKTKTMDELKKEARENFPSENLEENSG